MVAESPVQTRAIDDAELGAIDAWWRAANYLAVGQIYLLDNPMLERGLVAEDIKPRLLGHWGTSPGLNLVYAHLNRLIRQRDVNAIFLAGPGHGGPAAVANAYLEGTYSELYPRISFDKEGMRALFRQFSFPGGIPSHVAPETPGSIHEGGELGYVLSHAYGAAMDNPDLVVAAVVGDGEFETGPLAASWHSNKFVDPIADGAVLPILHLNGYKIANPTVPARIHRDELESLLRGYGHEVLTVEGDDPADVHRQMAAAMDQAHDTISEIWRAAREDGDVERRPWPMILMVTPKGWTGPKFVDGVPVEGTWRAHQVPLAGTRDNDEHRAQLEEWMRSYRAEELFDDDGILVEELQQLSPQGTRRMSANPHANGGLLTKPLKLPDFRDRAVEVTAPGASIHEPTRVLGEYLIDVVRDNPTNFRIFGPDETASNRLDPVYAVTDKVFAGEIRDTDEHLARSGRVVEILSEHTCQGWVEGYTLTGRHGLFSCYEAFIHLVDSMFNQHAKWLKTTRDIAWRPQVPSLNYLLSSHVWRQDHNGFSHQDPGFIDHVVNKRAEVVRVYLPPDANTLLSTMQHCLESRHYVNVVVSGKQPSFDWLTADEADLHCARGAGIWEFASNDDGRPEVVMACAGDVPTLEILAAVEDPARVTARPADPGRQRRRPDAAPGREGSPPRHARGRLRQPLRHRRPGDLRLPRLPVADPPADLQAPQQPAPARARLHRGRHHHHAVRHGDDEQHGPLPPGHGRHRPHAEPRVAGGVAAPGDGRHPSPRASVDAGPRRRPARGGGLGVDLRGRGP